MGYEHITHGFEPVYDTNSRILILGSLPSVKSREQGFYYGHPRNRFWTVIAAIVNKPLPVTIPDKKRLLLDSGIAVWDVISECDIIGSADAKIKNAVPANIGKILDAADIDKIFANGSTAAALYRKHIQSVTGREIIALPSTSPANAAWSTENLIDEWRKHIFLAI